MEEKDEKTCNSVREITADAFKLIVEKLGIDTDGNDDNETFSHHVSEMGAIVIEIVSKYIDAAVLFLDADREEFTDLVLNSIRKSTRLKAKLHDLVKRIEEGGAFEFEKENLN